MIHTLQIIIQVYMIICVLRIVFSWLPDLQESNAFVGAASNICYMLTEPVFSTVRKYMPRIGDLPIDFSPMVVFLVLGALSAILGAIHG